MRPSIAITLSALIITACSANTDARPWQGGVSARTGAYQLEVTDQWGSALRSYHHQGRTWVLGDAGQRYRIKVHNHSDRRIEAVISVDGRDAVDGRPGHTSKRGYVIDPHDHLLVDGFRMSMKNVATFRFSSVAQSYAARMGNAREVGVIGVAVYEEKRTAWRQPPPRPWRNRRSYEPREDEDDYAGAGAEKSPARSAPRTESPAAGAAPRDTADADAPSSRGRGDYGGKGGHGSARKSAERPGLGTRYGERRHAPATEVAFVRARGWRADHVLALNYNNRSGLLAMGIDLNPRRWSSWDQRRSEQRRRETARPFADMQRGFASPPPGWRD